MISILNYAWVASNTNIELFHKVILQIGLMFSYTYRNGIDTTEGIDYVLLAPLSHDIYDYLSENGEKSFLNINDYDINKRYFDSNSIENINGEIYQENSISKLIYEIGENNIIMCPKVMYYIEHEFSKKLFDMEIFDDPHNFPSLNYTPITFNGYNEIDLSIVLKEKTIIKENNRMNIIKLKNSTDINRHFNINQPGDIVFENNTNLFIEMKYSINNIDLSDELDMLCKKALRFSQAYKNAAYKKSNSPFFKTNISYIFLYDSSRNNILHSLQSRINEEVDILYNSPSVEISSIASLEKKIRKMGDEINLIKQDNKAKANEMNNMKKEMNDLKTEIKDIKLQMKEELRKNRIEVSLDFSLNELKRYEMNEKKITDVIKRIKQSNNITDFNLVKFHYNPFKKCAKFYKELNNNDQMIQLFQKIIGKKLKSVEEKNEYKRFIGLLTNKNNSDNVASKFYDAFKNMLLGKYSEKIQDYDIFCGEKDLCDILNEILLFIKFLEKEKDVEYYFYSAMFSLVNFFNSINENYGVAILKFIQSDDSVQNLVAFIIESINSNNLEVYIKLHN
jgi:hypothetical protein